MPRGHGSRHTFGLLEKFQQDLTDLDHDDKKDLKEDKRFKDCQTTCIARTWHDWDGKRSKAVCATCSKRDGPHPETEEIMGLYWMMAGGMPVSRDEFPADVWTCLGMYAVRNRVSLF